MAMVSGPCSDCHTMHNSQADLAMNYDGSSTPNPYLTRATCLGCHGQLGADNIVDGIPQVNHTNTDDLAAGNFAYMLGTKGVGGASDAKGHNVIDFGNLEDTLDSPPGMTMKHHGDEGEPRVEDFTCAGVYGCHGTGQDVGASDPMASIAGAHHANDNTIDGTSVGKSYRFLSGVVGLEVTDWQNTDSNHHNEYSGQTSPIEPHCSDCHDMSGSGTTLPAGSTITQLCTACHIEMHQVDSSGDGIWLRHPSDIVIPNSGEYAAYTTYNIDAPIGRVTIPASASDTVTPGTDVVTCLSCHFAHGSDYPDLLRWDYDAISAGGGSSGEGCFICHSTKDD